MAFTRPPNKNKEKRPEIRIRPQAPHVERVSAMVPDGTYREGDVLPLSVRFDQLTYLAQGSMRLFLNVDPKLPFLCPVIASQSSLGPALQHTFLYEVGSAQDSKSLGVRENMALLSFGGILKRFSTHSATPSNI